MAEVEAIEKILGEIKDLEGVRDVILVSRSGIHIAGKVPEGSHRETFSAMFAILFGAAETATSQLKKELRSVTVELEDSKVLTVSNGPKAVYVLYLDKDYPVSSLKEELKKKSEELQEFL